MIKVIRQNINIIVIVTLILLKVSASEKFSENAQIKDSGSILFRITSSAFSKDLNLTRAKQITSLSEKTSEKILIQDIKNQSSKDTFYQSLNGELLFQITNELKPLAFDHPQQEVYEAQQLNENPRALQQIGNQFERLEITVLNTTLDSLTSIYFAIKPKNLTLSSKGYLIIQYPKQTLVPSTQDKCLIGIQSTVSINQSVSCDFILSNNTIRISNMFMTKGYNSAKDGPLNFYLGIFRNLMTNKTVGNFTIWFYEQSSSLPKIASVYNNSQRITPQQLLISDFQYSNIGYLPSFWDQGNQNQIVKTSDQNVIFSMMVSRMSTLAIPQKIRVLLTLTNHFSFTNSTKVLLTGASSIKIVNLTDSQISFSAVFEKVTSFNLTMTNIQLPRIIMNVSSLTLSLQDESIGLTLFSGSYQPTLNYQLSAFQYLKAWPSSDFTSDQTTLEISFQPRVSTQMGDILSITFDEKYLRYFNGSGYITCKMIEPFERFLSCKASLRQVNVTFDFPSNETVTISVNGMFTNFLSTRRIPIKIDLLDQRINYIHQDQSYIQATLGSFLNITSFYANDSLQYVPKTYYFYTSAFDNMNSDIINQSISSSYYNGELLYSITLRLPDCFQLSYRNTKAFTLVSNQAKLQQSVVEFEIADSLDMIKVYCPLGCSNLVIEGITDDLRTCKQNNKYFQIYNYKDISNQHLISQSVQSLKPSFNCSDGCQYCKDNDKYYCTLCEDGKVSYNGLCINECYESFYILNGAQCIECPSSCSDDNFNSILCPSGCFQCQVSNCSSCSEPNICQQCDNDFILVQNQCIDKCAISLVQNNSQGAFENQFRFSSTQNQSFCRNLQVDSNLTVETSLPSPYKEYLIYTYNGCLFVFLVLVFLTIISLIMHRQTESILLALVFTYFVEFVSSLAVFAFSLVISNLGLLNLQVLYLGHGIQLVAQILVLNIPVICKLERDFRLKRDARSRELQEKEQINRVKVKDEGFEKEPNQLLFEGGDSENEYSQEYVDPQQYDSQMQEQNDELVAHQLAFQTQSYDEDFSEVVEEDEEDYNQSQITEQTVQKQENQGPITQSVSPQGSTTENENKIVDVQKEKSSYNENSSKVAPVVGELFEQQDFFKDMPKKISHYSITRMETECLIEFRRCQQDYKCMYNMIKVMSWIFSFYFLRVLESNLFGLNRFSYQLYLHSEQYQETIKIPTLVNLSLKFMILGLNLYHICTIYNLEYHFLLSFNSFFVALPFVLLYNQMRIDLNKKFDFYYRNNTTVLTKQSFAIIQKEINHKASIAFNAKLNNQSGYDNEDSSGDDENGEDDNQQDQSQEQSQENSDGNQQSQQSERQRKRAPVPKPNSDFENPRGLFLSGTQTKMTQSMKQRFKEFQKKIMSIRANEYEVSSSSQQSSFRRSQSINDSQINISISNQNSVAYNDQSRISNLNSQRYKASYSDNSNISRVQQPKNQMIANRDPYELREDQIYQNFQEESMHSSFITLMNPQNDMNYVTKYAATNFDAVSEEISGQSNEIGGNGIQDNIRGFDISGIGIKLNADLSIDQPNPEEEDEEDYNHNAQKYEVSHRNHQDNRKASEVVFGMNNGRLTSESIASNKSQSFGRKAKKSIQNLKQFSFSSIFNHNGQILNQQSSKMSRKPSNLMKMANDFNPKFKQPQ